MGGLEEEVLRVRCDAYDRISLFKSFGSCVPKTRTAPLALRKRSKRSTTPVEPSPAVAGIARLASSMTIAVRGASCVPPDSGMYLSSRSRTVCTTVG